MDTSEDEVGHDRARGEVRVGGDALHEGMVLVDREQRPGEPAGDQIGKEQAGEGVRVRAGPDHSNCLRMQECVQRGAGNAKSVAQIVVEVVGPGGPGDFPSCTGLP